MLGNSYIITVIELDIHQSGAGSSHVRRLLMRLHCLLNGIDHLPEASGDQVSFFKEAELDSCNKIDGQAHNQRENVDQESGLHIKYFELFDGRQVRHLNLNDVGVGTDHEIGQERVPDNNAECQVHTIDGPVNKQEHEWCNVKNCL